jgi:hypothetical protein
MFGVILPELIDILEGMLFLVKFTRAKNKLNLKHTLTNFYSITNL